MPGYDRRIDPVTRDYVDDGAGGFALTRTAETALYHQIAGHRDRWPGDPDAGCRLYQLPRKLSDEVVRVARDMVREAVQPLIDAGYITDYQLGTDRDQRGRLALSGVAHDIQSGELDITPMLPGGA